MVAASSHVKLEAEAAATSAAATRVTAEQEEELRLQAKEQAANALPFADLCKRLERVAHEIRQRDRKIDVLFPRQLRLALQGQSPYPLFRLLLPHIDNARGNYQMKQATLARFYVEVLGLDPRRSMDAQKLMRYRQPPPPRTLHSPKTCKVTYDWAEVLEDVLTGRVPQAPSSLTLEQVNALLDRLASAEDNAQRKAWLEEVAVRLSAKEQKWLARIVLQDLKIGMREEMVLGFFHERGQELYDSTSDLRYVCAVLSEGGGRIVDRASLNIQLNRPFTPMLAAAIHHQLHKVEPAMRGHPFAVETKIDGERMLCHRQGSQVAWYTRSATNYTDRYGPHLTPWVLRCVKAANCILDGEVVGWDHAHQAFLHFKENRSIAIEEKPTSSPFSEEGGLGEHDNPQPRSLVFVAFDVIYLDDGPNTQPLLDACIGSSAGVDASERRPGSITHLPLRARRDLLERIVEPQHRRLELVRHERIEDTSTEVRLERLITAFDDALQNMEEGLLVKDLESPYVLGERGRGMQYWLKMKPEYSDLTKNLDVLVLGAYFSKGKRRSGRLASFLMGVAEPPAVAAAATAKVKKEQQQIEEEEEEEEDLLLMPWANPPKTPRTTDTSANANQQQEQQQASSATAPDELFKPDAFYTVGRCGSGITFSEWEELEKRVPFKPWPKRGRLPKHFKPWKPARGDVPDFYVEPEKSCVLEVKCMAIVESESFSSGYTLRFPRTEAIRYNKAWYSCLTLPELQAIYAGPAANRRGALEAMVETQGQPLLSKRQRKSQSQLLAKMGEEPSVSSAFVKQEEGGGGCRRAGPLPIRVIDAYRTTDPALVERKDNLLKGLEICVMGDFDLAEVSSDDDAAYTSSGPGSGSDTSKGSAAAASVPSVSSSGDHRAVFSKADVEKLVAEHGGRLTSSPRLGETALVVAPDAKSLRVKLLIRAGRFDVVSLSYLLRVVREGQLTPPRFLEYIFMTKETRAVLTEMVDEYGDSYTDPTTPNALLRCMRHIKTPLVAPSASPPPPPPSLHRKSKHGKQITRPPQAVGRLPWRAVAQTALRRREDHRLLLSEGAAFNFLFTFGWHVFYLDRFEDLGPLQVVTADEQVEGESSPPTMAAATSPHTPLPVTRLDHLAYAIPLYGGIVSTALHTGVTHVIVDRLDTRRFALISARLKALRRLPVAQVEKRVVRYQWMDECLSAKRVVEVEKRDLVALR